MPRILKAALLATGLVIGASASATDPSSMPGSLASMSELEREVACSFIAYKAAAQLFTTDSQSDPVRNAALQSTLVVEAYWRDQMERGHKWNIKPILARIEARFDALALDEHAAEATYCEDTARSKIARMNVTERYEFKERSDWSARWIMQTWTEANAERQTSSR